LLKADRPLAIAWWVALGLRGLLPAGRDLYYDYYEPDDHERVASFVTRKIARQKWIVSYDNVKQVRDLYARGW